MDRREIQMVSHEFRDLVSQASRSHFEDLQINIRRLLDFVESTPLLAEAIERAARPDRSPKDVIDSCRSRRGRIKPTPDRRHELGFLHDLLVTLAHLDEKERQGLIIGYGHHRRFQDSARELLGDTVTPYATHLRRVITAALADAGEEGAPRLSINTTGGLSQVVVHQGQGDVQANQVALQYASEVAGAAEKLLEYLESEGAAHLASDEADDLTQIARDLPQEVVREKPSKWGLKAMQERLQLFLTTSEAAERLRPYVQPLLDSLSEYLRSKGVG